MFLIVKVGCLLGKQATRVRVNKAKSKIDKMSYLQLKQAMRSKGKNYTGKTSDELRKELKLLTK